MTTKPLRDIVSKFKEDPLLKGKYSSTTSNAEVYGGKDASVNVNDPSTVKFVEKHKVETHADRVGNTDLPYKSSKGYALKDLKNKRLSRTEDESKKVYEAKTCNKTRKGVLCPVHGMAPCSTVPATDDGEGKE